MEVLTDAHAWELVFQDEESRQYEAASWMRDMSGNQASSRETDQDRTAKLGIVWVSSGSDIFYNIRVNDEPLPPPNVANGGQVVRDIVLRKGSNRIYWAIQHAKGDWQHAVYLKLGDSVRKLREDRGDSQNGEPACAAASIIVKVP